MGTIRVRFILVALAVSFFAVGMAAFLNYFKYKSTISSIVKSRVLVVGRNIENSVQASLAIGMQFTELQQLTQLMQREKSSDRLVRGIDVFDTSGNGAFEVQRITVEVTIDRREGRPPPPLTFERMGWRRLGGADPLADPFG